MDMLAEQSPTPVMREGAFVLVDCLGFRGIWKDSTEPLLKKLSNIRRTVDSGLQESEISSMNPEDVEVTIRLLSDTVAMGFQPKKDFKNVELTGWAVELAVKVVPDIVRLYLEGDPALALRGCISVGQHLCDGNFLIGPAVDDAAKHMDEAQGAFIWLLPSATERYHAWKDSQIRLFHSMND